MKPRVLLSGVEPHTRKLIIDVLSLTLSTISVETAQSLDEFYTLLNNASNQYTLIILNCETGGKDKYSAAILKIRQQFKKILGTVVLLFESTQDIPDDTILLDIPYVVKPFSLDRFEEIVKTICSP